MCYWMCSYSWSVSRGVLSIQSSCRVNSTWQRPHMIRNKGRRIATQNLYEYAKLRHTSFQLSPAQVDLTTLRVYYRAYNCKEEMQWLITVNVADCTFYASEMRNQLITRFNPTHVKMKNYWFKWTGCFYNPDHVVNGWAFTCQGERVHYL